MRRFIYVTIFSVFIFSELASSAERVLFLVSDSEGISTAESIVNQSLSEKDTLKQVFSDPAVESIGFVFHDGLRLSNSSESTVRGRMARYLIAEITDLPKAQSFVTDLKNDSRIIEAYIEQPIIPDGGTTCDFSNVVIDFSSVNKTWAQQVTNISQSLSVGRGGASIATVDFGIDQSHPNLIDFSGNNYVGGGFHQNLAIDFGGRVFDVQIDPLRPFGAGADFKWADEYNWREVEQSKNYGSWLNCDDPQNGGNNNGFIQSRFVGHGTHVAGLIVGSVDSASGWRGTCQDCSLMILRSQGQDGQCYSGALQPHTSPPVQYETGTGFVDAWAGIGIATDIGAQIINMSFGSFQSPQVSCSDPSFQNTAGCLAIQFADSRGVILSAAAGNRNRSVGMDFPASDPRVIGVTGISPDGSRWNESASCGSSFEPIQPGSIENYPHFTAPAQAVYSTMYPNMNYIPAGCHVANDGDQDNGFGYCTGTSMSAPILSGILGLVRTTMPLAPVADVVEATRKSTDRFALGQPRNNQFGFGIPKADLAIQEMLGISDGNQLVNRLTPLFTFYSQAGLDSLAVTKPQIAVAFSTNTYLLHTSLSDSPPVSGFAFDYDSGDTNQVSPRADVFIFTTHVSPDSLRSLVPLYRMRKVDESNPAQPNHDSILVFESELNFRKANGYDLEGLTGYVFNPTTGQPPGTVQLLRAENPSRMDHAVFPQSRQLNMQQNGYNSGLTLLGYAYPNTNSDSDELIDGQEILLGTDIFDQDSNCDTVPDDQHYPQFGLPVSDPLAGPGCSADLELSGVLIRGDITEFTVLNLGILDSDGAELDINIQNSDNSITWWIREESMPGCTLTSPTNGCGIGTANSCSVSYRCIPSPDLGVGQDYIVQFEVNSNKNGSFQNITASAVVNPTGSIFDLNNNNNSATVIQTSTFP